MTISPLPTENPHAAPFACSRRTLGITLCKLKKLRGHTDVWAVKVTLDVRAVGYRQGDTIEWVWIGTHNEFDKLLADRVIARLDEMHKQATCAKRFTRLPIQIEVV
jgi:hypothetical protein